MFERLVHADWSTNNRKRWAAVADRSKDGWIIEAPLSVPNDQALLNEAFEHTVAGHRVLLGFDFPIGLPIAYGSRTELPDFLTAHSYFGRGEWAHFFDPADDPAQIELHRPFYPRTPRKGVKRATLFKALGMTSFDQLMRACERKTSYKAAACSLFWTLGGNQVGRAAIAGWREIVVPSTKNGRVKLWPFHGHLAELAANPGITIAETYPAEAYHHVGIAFGAKQSKRRQADRQSKATAILAWADRQRVRLTDAAHAVIVDGFGNGSFGEDAFDALAGLLGMIEVADGRRGEGPVEDLDVRCWEGWILGQCR